MTDKMNEEPLSNISDSSFVILGLGSLAPSSGLPDFNDPSSSCLTYTKSGESFYQTEKSTSNEQPENKVTESTSIYDDVPIESNNTESITKKSLGGAETIGKSSTSFLDMEKSCINEHPKSKVSESISVYDDVPAEPILNELHVKNSSTPESNKSCLTNGMSDTSFFELNVINNEPTVSQHFETTSFDDDNPQQKLNYLMKQNYKLKENLNQFNADMKFQLNKFFLWQSMVLKTQETHKQKFAETYDLILKLRNENENLKKQLDNDTQITSAINSDGGNNETDDSLQQISKSDEIDNLKEEVNKFQNICDALTNENIPFNYAISGKLLVQAKAAITQLNVELEKLLEENSTLKEKINKNQNNLLGGFNSKLSFNADYHMQINNLFKQLEQENSKIMELKNELEMKKSLESEPKLNAAEELTGYFEKLKNVNSSFKDQIERFSSIMSWVSIAEDNIKDSNDAGNKSGTDSLVLSEIVLLKSHLLKEGNIIKQKQENLYQLNEKLQKLLKDIQTSQEKLKSLEKNAEDVQKYRDQVESLTIQLKHKEDELMSAEHEHDKLKQSIESLNAEKEEINVLKLQAQLYKNDFNDEREAREKIVGEKEKLAEQVRLLERKIKDLEGNQNKSNPESSKESLSSTEEKSPSYTCPRCVASFKELERCLNHIEECLDENIYT